MITKTIFLPNSKKPELEVEVSRAGDIVQCFAFIPGFDTWINGMEYLKVRPGLIMKIREEAATLNWNDHGDTAYDSFKDQMAEVFGGKLA